MLINYTVCHVLEEENGGGGGEKGRKREGGRGHEEEEEGEEEEGGMAVLFKRGNQEWGERVNTGPEETQNAREGVLLKALPNIVLM